MSFRWKSKNARCVQSYIEDNLQSVSAPLVVSLRPTCVWLIVRFNTSGFLDVFQGDGGALSWRRQKDVPHIRTADSPGGAASADGKTVLLVYRDFWGSHLLWSFWAEQHGWCGNRPIQIPLHKQSPLFLESNGRGPVVVFSEQQYWVFYVNEERHLCSITLDKFSSKTGLPLWKMPRAYTGCPDVKDGKPCVLARDHTLSVYYHSVKGLACLVLDAVSGATLQCYSLGPHYLSGFRGSPTIVDFHCLHLFYRNPKNRVCWYICQEDVQKRCWTQASDMDLLGIKSSHAVACYVNADKELCVLAATHPSFLGDLHFSYSEKPAIRQSVLGFESLQQKGESQTITEVE